MGRVARLILLLFCLLAVRLTNSARSNSRRNTLKVNYSVLEETQGRTRIGTIGLDAGLQRQYGADIFNLLTYSFSRSAKRYAEFFSLEEEGALWVEKGLDREDLCAQESSCTITLDVVVKPVPELHILVFQVIVHVLDINDHTPVFPVPHHTVTIPESAFPGTRFALPSAEDADSNQYGIQTYFLTATDPKTTKTLLHVTSPFDLAVTNSTDGARDVKLVVKDQLDKEKKSNYTLWLVAKDGGSPPKSATMALQVRILDVNDNSPVFSQSMYVTHIREDIEVSGWVLQVQATDRDEGRNGLVAYSFTEATERQYGSVFDIDNETGVISTLEPLDREDRDIYHLFIIACDRGPNAIPVQVKVTVHVDDVNDNAPMITLNDVPTRPREIPENTKSGYFVAHISIEDLDSDYNSFVTCSINDTRFTIETIFDNEYKILSTASFDREQRPQYVVLVTCEDEGEPPLKSSKTIIVDVTDVNDNAPVFTERAYSATIKENNTKSLVLLVVNATDADSGDNAHVSYRLARDALGMMAIDSESGLLRTNAVFDYERIRTFVFGVVAYDHGSPARSSTATVTLNIEDINDEAPTFAHSIYNFGTFEKQAPGTEIGVVTAYDADSPPFNEFTFTIDQLRGSPEFFEIDIHTGRITTTRELDREEAASYSFVVMAINPSPLPSDPVRTGSVEVTVYVADVNDNAPEVYFPTPQDDEVQVPAAAHIGYIFSRVKAKDPDVGSNAQLSYVILQGNDDDAFGIDTQTGALTVETDLHMLHKTLYKLLLEISDHGVPQRAVYSELKVVVNYTLQVTFSSSLSPHTAASSGAIEREQLVIILLSSGTGLLVLLLLVTIFLIRRRHRKQSQEAYKYKCRVDMAQRLSTLPDPESWENAENDYVIQMGPQVSPTSTITTSPLSMSERSMADGSSAPMCITECVPEETIEEKKELLEKENEEEENTAEGEDGYLVPATLRRQPASPEIKLPIRVPSSAKHRLTLDPNMTFSELTPQEMEAHNLLQMLTGTVDSSDSESDSSNRDSGHGTSEDDVPVRLDTFHPPPPKSHSSTLESLSEETPVPYGIGDTSV